MSVILGVLIFEVALVAYVVIAIVRDNVRKEKVLRDAPEESE